jgi:F-type H+-transporting ATPase subunit gamma
METLESLRGKMKSAEDLHSIARTMKALAAVNIRQYETALDSLVHYSRTVEMGLQIILKGHRQDIARMDTIPGGPLGAVIFGANQGLAGQFNNRVVSYALRGMEKLGAPPEQRHVVAVGLRAASHLQHAGQPVEETIVAPSSLSGVTSSVTSVLLKVEEWREEQDIHRIVLFFNTPISGASYRARMRWLLPIDLDWLDELRKERWDSRVLPIYTMDWNGLFSALLRQYYFVLLYRSFIESLASENASRLATMQAAEQNIEERLTELTAHYHHLRQTSITEELLDIASGFEALAGES